MAYQYAAWLFLLPFMLLALILLGFVIWSEISNVSLKEYWTVVTNPDQAVEELVEKSNITKLPSMQDNPFAQENPVEAQLDADAHSNAYIQFCDRNNLRFDDTLQECVARTEKQCDDKSIKKLDLTKYDPVHKPQLAFVNDKCVTTLGLDNFCRDAKFEKAIGTPDVGLPRQPANVTCDVNNICSAPDNPRCVITKGYCERMGITFNGKDDCYVQKGQHIAELIFGKTITRKYKQTIQKLVERCKDDGPFSDKCLWSELYSIFIPITIIYDDVASEYRQAKKDWDNSCVKKTQVTAKLVGECIEAMFEFFPPAFLLIKLVEVAVMLIKSAIPTITKYVHEGWLAIKNFGNPVLNAFGITGDNDAPHSVWNAGGLKAVGSIENCSGLTFDNELRPEKWVRADSTSLKNAKFSYNPLKNIGGLAADAITGNGPEARTRAKILGLSVDHGFASMGSFTSKIVTDKGTTGIIDSATDYVRYYGNTASTFATALAMDPDPSVSQVGTELMKSIAHVDKNVKTQCLGLFC